MMPENNLLTKLSCSGLCLAWLLTATPAGAFQLLGEQWPGPTVTFYVDIPGSNGLWNDAFESAMSLWNTDASFDYRIVRNTFEDPCMSNNNRNGVGFTPDVCGDPYGSMVLAVTQRLFIGTTIIESNVVFNESESWNVYSGPWQSGGFFGISDFRRVAVHELGHALGLAHEDSIPSVMSTFVGDIEAPTADDAAGVAALYFGGSGPSVAASILPGSRSAQVGSTASAFATIISTGSTTATGCGISPLTQVPAGFFYQTTDPATNLLTGTPDTPADIPAGGQQSFLFAFTPSSAFNPTEMQLDFDCTNTSPATVVSGLNTLLLSASGTPVPDIIALATTPSGNGAISLPDPTAAGAFAVAAANVGVAGTIAVSVDTGTQNLPVALSICETDPGTGSCLGQPAPGVTTAIGANATPTFSIFLSALGTVVPFDPAVNRVFVRFTDTGGESRGATSVALEIMSP